MRPGLVFHGPHYECAHKANEISAFGPELVFRDIPGKLLQRARQTQRFRRPLLCRALLNPVTAGVVRVTPPPVGL